jgi:hypothetical protein
VLYFATLANAKEKLTFDDNGPVLALFGHADSNLRLIERELGIELHSKSGELTLVGDEAKVALAKSLITQLYDLVKRGRQLMPVDIARAAATIKQAPAHELSDIFADTLLIAGRQRSITNPVRRFPTVVAARMSPNGPAPPRWALATSGPSTFTAPSCAATTNENCSTIAQSQVRDQKSCQPSRISCQTVLPAVRTTEGIRIRTSTRAATP